jgi:hypothetical protein
MFNLRSNGGGAINDNINNAINDNVNNAINDNVNNEINDNINNKNKIKKSKKEYTIEEKDAIIKNTIHIPKDKWMNLEPGVFISYDRLDDTFVKGGYIQIVNKSKAGKDYFRIIFNQNDTQNGYTLYLDQIKTIYKKIDETSYYELHAIREAYDIVINKLSKQVEDQNLYISKLEERLITKIEKNESNAKKILQKVKDLHDL